MTPFRVFVAVFTTLAIIWIVLQLVLFTSCLQSNKLSPMNVHVLCKRDQNFLLVHILDTIRTQPECGRILKVFQSTLQEYKGLPFIYVITPTYKRFVQKADLTRLSHTLMLVPNIHWIVVEDSANRTELVTNFLAKCNIPYIHLNIPTPEQLKMTSQDPNWLKPRGVLQRNKALAWLRQHLHPNEKGVIYFADDDNTYDLELFQEMRYTKTVSVWPVGLVGGLMVEKPLVEKGKVIGWNTVWKADRPFPIDMAGFAVNLTMLLQHPKSAFSIRVPRGYQESKLLKDLVTMDELEPKADNCTKVLVWHTRTEHPKLKQERKLIIPSNVNMEV